MASLKWTLCLLYFYLKAIHTETKSWTIKVPPLIKGLPGSCVVIPCSFDFPDQGKKLTQFTGMWKDASNQFIYHPEDSKIMQTYQNRTKLLGNLTQKDCSLQINPLNHSDQGPFHFRIEIAHLNKFSYIQNTVAIADINDLGPMSLSVNGEVREGRTASVSCSITHSCPTSPPVFTWSHLGREDVQHTLFEHGWRTTSTLSFQPSREDHNKHLWCSVRYKGGQQQQETTSLLKVMYVPEIRNGSHCTSEAKLLTCVCIVESNPPSREVQFMLSNRILDSTIVKTNGTVTMGILQAEQRPHKFIQCLANNTLGRTNLTLSVTLLHSTRMTNLYIIIAVAGGVLLLTLLILATVVQKWRRTGAPQTSHLEMDKVVASPQMRKEDDVHGNEVGQMFGCPLYENVQTYINEPTYANK